MTSDDDVKIYAEGEAFAEVFNKLASVASSPKEIRTESGGSVPLVLLVSQDLYARYLALDEQPEEPKKRGPGRPRKEQPPASESEPTP